MSKRLFDLFFSLVGILIFSPVWLMISILILIEDGRPLLFRQSRAGKHFKPFTIHKFRSMTQDGKVTRVGQWIRKTGLDESLQFINVLKGEMSFVGPRPITESDIDKLQWNRQKLAWRWWVRPGITGYAQLFEPLANKRSLVRDRQTVRIESRLTELKILAMTFLVNVLGKPRARKVMRL